MPSVARIQDKAAAKPKVVRSLEPVHAAETVSKSGPGAKSVVPRVPRKPRRNGAAIPDAQRRNYIEVAAYYIAQRRGFPGNSELEDWIEAEAEVDRLLREGRINP